MSSSIASYTKTQQLERFETLRLTNARQDKMNELAKMNGLPVENSNGRKILTATRQLNDSPPTANKLVDRDTKTASPENKAVHGFRRRKPN